MYISATDHTNQVGTIYVTRLRNVAGPIIVKLVHFFHFIVRGSIIRKVMALTIDGADEVDPELNVIKGGGGALLREKIIAQASGKNIIIVDESKLSPQLGTKWALPIEVIPFACRTEQLFLESIGGSATLRAGDNKSPYLTNQNNFILDTDFGPIADPAELVSRLNERAGIVEHGLFLGLATDVIVAAGQGIRHLRRDGGRL